jgi:hypothetical protein
MASTEAINLSEVVPHQITPTEKFFNKKDKQGNVINKFPNMFAVRCSYRGNNNYLFYATQTEVDQITPVSRKEFNELCAEVNAIRGDKTGKK